MFGRKEGVLYIRRGYKPLNHVEGEMDGVRFGDGILIDYFFLNL